MASFLCLKLFLHLCELIQIDCRGRDGKRPILWAGRACLTALIIPAAPAPWLGLDNRLEEGL